MFQNKTIRVLFVASRGKENILVRNQATTLCKFNIIVDFFAVQSGILNYLMSIVKLKKHLINNHYDLIHAHYGWCGIVSLFGKKREKLIVSFMGDDLVGSLNRKYKYTFKSKLVSYLNIFFAKYFYDFNIVKSINLYEKLKGISNVEIIPNGVNLELFKSIDKSLARDKLSWEPDKKYIIFVTNPEREEKNFKLAEDAVKRLDNASVILLPVFNIPNERLYLYYSAADLILLTSFHEGSPNVIKEAMACNCPIVSTDVGDIRWVIGDTEGCYITSFEPEEVAKKLQLALDFAERKGRTNGRDRIIKLGLDSETIATKIINIYEKVLNRK